MFKINGIIWRVVDVPPTDPMLRRPNGSLSVGACDNATKTIYLSAVLSGAFKRKVLCHEVTHAAMFSYKISMTLEQEEIVADIIATYGNEIIEITNILFYGIRGR
jgi:hypothetical protein